MLSYIHTLEWRLEICLEVVLISGTFILFLQKNLKQTNQQQIKTLTFYLAKVKASEITHS